MNKTRRINITDLVLISILLCLIIIFGYTSFSGKATVDMSQKETFNVLIFTDEILIKNTDLIKVGDKITLSETNTEFGTIKSIKLENTSLEVVNKANNTSTVYKLPDKKNATILVECSGEFREGMFYIGKVAVVKGETLSMHTHAISFEAAIINVEEGK